MGTLYCIVFADGNLPMTDTLEIIYLLRRRLSVLALLSATLLAPAQAQGFENSTDRLKATKVCPRCDLSKADLKKTDLRNADLRHTVLLYADLKDANLKEANLSGTILFAADLSGADLSGAKLYGAYLSEADLSGANLKGAILWGTVLFKANLTGVDMTGASMKDVNLDGALLCRTKMPSGREDNSGCK
jgi:uncharacterized protein YjbI with pentapeptide repeats